MYVLRKRCIRKSLRLVAAGGSNPEIAEALVISENTVIRHVSDILAKTGSGNRTEAAAYATRRGIAAEDGNR